MPLTKEELDNVPALSIADLQEIANTSKPEALYLIHNRIFPDHANDNNIDKLQRLHVANEKARIYMMGIEERKKYLEELNYQALLNGRNDPTLAALQEFTAHVVTEVDKVATLPRNQTPDITQGIELDNHYQNKPLDMRYVLAKQLQVHVQSKPEPAPQLSLAQIAILEKQAAEVRKEAFFALLAKRDDSTSQKIWEDMNAIIELYYNPVLGRDVKGGGR